MRIRRLQISGYRNLREISVEFDDLTVLVGKNDVGKTNVLRAIEFLLQVSRFEHTEQIASRGGGGGNPTHWSYDNPLDYRLFEGDKPGRIAARLTVELSEESWTTVFSVPAPWRLKKKSYRVGDIGSVSFDWIVNLAPIPEGESSEQEPRERVEIQVSRIATEGGLQIYDANKGGEAALVFAGDGFQYGSDLKLVERLIEEIAGRRRGRGSPLGRKFLIVGPDRIILPVTVEPEGENAALQGARLAPRNLPDALALYRTQTDLYKSGLLQALVDDVKFLFPSYPEFQALDEGPGSQRDIFFGRFPSTQVGAGVKQVLSCLFSIRSNSPEVVAVEEPEIHLHPDKQREFYRYLRELTKGSQLIVTTHSPTIVADSPLSSLRLVRATSGKQAEVVRLDDENLHQVANELGILPRDILEFEACMLVEGYVDRVYFEEVIEKLSKGSPPASVPAVIDVGGWGNVAAYANAQVLSRLKRRFLIVLDGDTRTVPSKKTALDVYLARTKLRRGRIATLKLPTIEHYLALPRAIVRAFPGLDGNEVERILEVAGKRRNLKEPLARIFRDGLGRKFTVEDARSIARCLKNSEIPREIRDIVNRLKERPNEGQSAHIRGKPS